MNKAKFAITYYYARYESGDIDKRYQRTASVWACSLSEAISKVKEFDPDYINVADSGVHISEVYERTNKSETA